MFNCEGFFGIQIQPMLRLNLPFINPLSLFSYDSNTTNVKVKFLHLKKKTLSVNHSNTTNVKVKSTPYLYAVST